MVRPTLSTKKTPIRNPLLEPISVLGPELLVDVAEEKSSTKGSPSFAALPKAFQETELDQADFNR